MTANKTKTTKNSSGKKPKSSQVLQTKLDNITALYQRALADYQNLEKRTNEQQSSYFRLANISILSKFIGVLDNLELAAGHISDPGLNMVITQFEQIFQDEGVVEVDTSGEFDPNTMECTSQVAGKHNQVIDTVSKGFMLGDSLLRPAKVTVGSDKP